jgi:hypothetical protein
MERVALGKRTTAAKEASWDLSVDKPSTAVGEG